VEDYLDLVKILLMLVLLIVPLSAFAEFHSDPSETYTFSKHVVSVDEHVYAIPYHVDAHVIAMAIDPELTSLLIGLENTKESVFVIDLEHKIISAENNAFAILVNGFEVDYHIVSDSDSSTLAFYVPDFTEEVEIIGTHVIPEFPIGAIMGFALLISIVVIFPKIKSRL